MRRERIDVAVHAQLDRLTYLLRDVVRSGGKDRWAHLFSHGHSHPTVRKALGQGYIRESGVRHYEITEAGTRYLEDIETAKALQA